MNKRIHNESRPRRATAVMLSLLMLASAALAEDAPSTIVRVTDKVLVKNTVRLGNHCNPGMQPALTMRQSANFEGGIHRACFYTGSTKGLPAGWISLSVYGDRINPFRGPEARCILLSGPQKWRTFTIKQIVKAESGDYHLELDRKVELMEGGWGVMLDACVNEPVLSTGDSGSGCHIQYSGGIRAEKGDTPPGTFGVGVARIPVGHSIDFWCGRVPQGAIEINGTWRLRFWAKAAGSQAVLKIQSAQCYDTLKDAPKREVKPKDQWERIDLTIPITTFPEPDQLTRAEYFKFQFSTTEGDVLIDDVEIWRAEDESTSAYRKDVVNALKELRPGVLRWFTTTCTVRDLIGQPLGIRNGHGHLHGCYQLCEEIGAEPYITLPSTLTCEEITQFMEYLGAPADVGWGKLRAELGHPKPWTETLAGINIEFGNEMANFGGFGGRDYWHDLIETAKESKYYSPKVYFTMGIQGNEAFAWDLDPA